MKIPLSVYDIFGYLASGFMVLAAVEFAFDGHWLLDRKWNPGSTGLYIMMAYVLGHIIADLASKFLEHGFGRGVLGPSEELLFKAPPSKSQKGWLWSKIYPGFFRPLPVETRERIIKTATPEGFAKPSRGLFFHAFAVVKGDKATQERLATFVNLYGFCRNISLALIVSALVIVASGIWYAYKLHSTEVDWNKVGIALLCCIGAVIMFNRYLKFYRIYTQEVFISYPEIKAKDTQKDADEGQKGKKKDNDEDSFEE